MKCTNNRRLLYLLGVAAVFISGCGKTQVSFENPYSVYEQTAAYGISSQMNSNDKAFFSENLCVIDDVALGTESTHSEVAMSAGVFNLATNTVTYAQNIYDKMYPASTTKIMTAYLAIKYGNLDEYVTISENVLNLDPDSSVCNLKPGDIISLRDLVYGLLIKSGNDAAVAIAEHISGSEEAFAALMNEEAAAMGASCTHFMNAHGLPDENHYTSCYDLYLIFQNCLMQPEFVKIIQTRSYDVVYTNSNGDAVSYTWENTNRYLTGSVETPEGVTVLGGKTGTTGQAGYCLLLYSTNSNNEPIVSIVLKADGRSNLYLLMNEILTGFAN